MRHPNLMICHEYFYDKIDLCGNNVKYLITILEHIPGYNLQQIIFQKLEKMVDKLTIYIPQIVSAMKYLHVNNIIHRDIKPENIMVSDGVVKLIDYDFLMFKQPNLIKKVGTPFYTSPEIYRKENYNEKTDLWSLGITIYFSLTGKQPFFSKDEEELKNKILSDYENQIILGYQKRYTKYY